jgi:hypothetical protein
MLTHDEIRAAIASGCSAEAFSEMACPRCGERLSIKVPPNGRGAYVRCVVSPVHLGMHIEIESGDPPAWWLKHVVTTGWY